MATEDLVTEQFQFLGIDVKNEVLSKCISLCEDYNVDAETFVELWMAFSLTHLNGASPTLEHLDLLERKEFSKRTADRLTTITPNRASAGAALPVYGAPTPIAIDSDNDVISNYVSGSNKKIKTENEPSTNTLNDVPLCPASYSPNVGHSAKYASRNNAGSVVHSYGDEKLLENFSKLNSMNNILNTHITQIPNDEGELYTKSMFGFELLHEKASIFDNHIQYISEYIMKKAGLSGSVSVRHKAQDEVIVAGRIECDADARLNPKCVVLQGTWQDSLSQTVPVDLDNVKQYSLFPGQVVAMRGVNPRGDKFIAHEIFADAARPVPDHRADLINSLRGKLSMVVAAGPYTTSDNMAYEPLKDLVTYIASNKPHVTILTGPFIDCEHTKVKDNSMAETYKSFFDKLIDSLGELQSTSPNTKIYIVSSLKDAFHVNIYPTPAYSTRRKHPNIHFVPDPSTLSIGGVIVTVTSSDVLMHISQEEISFGEGGDKLSRACRLALQQQSAAPRVPAPRAQPTDAPLWAAHAHLPHTPHLLLLPSNFRYFVKEVNGCVVVNPEHLAKGTVGGTFARILLSSESDAPLEIAAQILRI